MNSPPPHGPLIESFKGLPVPLHCVQKVVCALSVRYTRPTTFSKKVRKNIFVTVVQSNIACVHFLFLQISASSPLNMFMLH
jgi:hypothetical protein